MEKIRYKAIDKLFYTEDKYTEQYRDTHTLNFQEVKDDNQISLALAAYLEAKTKLDKGDIALGMSTISNPNILALEMNINEKDRVGVSISNTGAIYGLWFKRDNVFINSSISVGASFRESIALVGLLLEATRLFSPDQKAIEIVYTEIVNKIKSQEDLTSLLLELNNVVRDFAATFVWLNNVGEISYRELYIFSLPYKSAIDKVMEGRDNFILYPRVQ